MSEQTTPGAETTPAAAPSPDNATPPAGVPTENSNTSTDPSSETPTTPAPEKGPEVGVPAGEAAKGADDSETPAAYLDSLSGDNKAVAERHGWKSVDDIVKSYDELHKDYSSRPVGKTPEKAEDYQFKVPDNAEHVGYSHEFADAFKGKLHELGIPQEAGAGLHDWFVDFAGEDAEAMAQAHIEARNQSVADTHNALVKDWGHDETEGFQRNVELMQRSIRLLDPALKESLQKNGTLTEVGGREYITDPTMAKVLSKVGGELYSEDSIHRETTANSNPFATETEDLQAQSHLIRTNPQKAAQLIKASGRERMFSYALSQIEGRK